MAMIHCCADMNSHINTSVAIKYIPKFNEYGILIQDGGTSFQEIYYCPWCGKKLPNSLRERWFEIVFDELGFDEADDPDVPGEMTTDEWWRKGKL